jgi:protoporphyrinogen oxidase
MTDQKHVVILGAGPAGVGAAWQLARTGRAKVTVLERGAVVGGNAGSFELAGLKVDYGSHRLHPACAPEILNDINGLLGDELLDRPRHGRIRMRGRWIHFPLKPLDALFSMPPGFVLGAAFDSATGLFRRRAVSTQPQTFESIMLAGLGPTICRDFYFPYARKIWGVDPVSLSGEQARRRVQASSPAKLIRKLLSSLPLAGSRRGQRFFYPRAGFGQITQAYGDAAQKFGAEIRFGATVQTIDTTDRAEAGPDSRRAHTVSFQTIEGTETVAADHVWSSIPISSLVRCLQPAAPASVVEAAGQIRFRAMTLVYLVIDQPQFSEFDAHYFPEIDVPVSRISEPRNYSAMSEPRDHTVLCAELPGDPGDEFWSLDDNQLGQVVSKALSDQGIPIKGKITQVLTRRLPQAYPIYELGFEKHFDCMDQWLDRFENIVTFGRQGLFAHDNTHHALAMAYAAVDCLSDNGDFDRQAWSRARLEFQKHVVED